MVRENLGTFYGIGVGPGPQGFIPVIALEILKKCEVIFCPRAASKDDSVAQYCLRELDISPDKMREVIFEMSQSHDQLSATYQTIAQQIFAVLQQSHDVAYLTLGDPMTYSTYIYTLDRLKQFSSEIRYQTFPGITSYHALASALDWPLGEQKERTLILPCPDDPTILQDEILSHDVLILMKIGKRFPMVLQVLRELNIDHLCAFGQRIGLAGEILYANVAEMQGDQEFGYLSTLLIRKKERIPI